MQVYFKYIDTCYPYKLTDRHNGKNEWLVSVNWYKGITTENLADEIVDEIMNNWPDFDEFTAFFSGLEDRTVRLILRELVAVEVASIDLDLKDVAFPNEMMIYSYLSW